MINRAEPWEIEVNSIKFKAVVQVPLFAEGALLLTIVPVGSTHMFRSLWINDANSYYMINAIVRVLCEDMLFTAELEKE